MNPCCRHPFHRALRLVITLLLAVAAPALCAQTLIVAVDSSLAPALTAAARAFEVTRQGVSVQLRSGASGVLLDQVTAGTPTDVLASIGPDTAALGVQRQLLVPDLRNIFATSTLVLVAPASLSLPLQRLADLARPEVVRIAMGREASVPAGRYARAAIDAQRLWPAVQGKIVRAADVGEVLAWVAAADVEAGFVFATDAAAAPAGRVRVVATLATPAPVRCLASVVAGSRQPALARDFVDFLRSEPARAVFRQAGFGLP